MHKVIIKEPGKNLEIVEIQEVDLKFLQQKVDGTIDIKRLSNRIDMVINEDTPIENLEPNFFYGITSPTEGYMIYGTVVFKSYDDKGYPIGLSADQIVRIFEMFSL